MHKVLIASAFTLGFTGFALAMQEGIPNPYFIALHMDSNTCVIMNKEPNSKYFESMSKYDSMEAAHKAMGSMKECG